MPCYQPCAERADISFPDGSGIELIRERPAALCILVISDWSAEDIILSVIFHFLYPEPLLFIDQMIATGGSGATYVSTVLPAK